MTTCSNRTDYEYWFQDIADPRVEDWLFMNGPLPLIAILTTYLTVIKLILPSYINQRKPYELKTTIFLYNLFQIGSCMAIVYGMITSGWTTNYNLLCQEVDYSDDPESVRMLKFVYSTFWLKIIELVETAFFVLRKKFRQVSVLHIFHHCTTLIMAWLASKYFGGGMLTFHIILNSTVHIFMYVYYLLASLGPNWQRALIRWKPKLTKLQLVQFCILLGHSLLALRKECNVPKFVVYIYIPIILLNMTMFGNFYVKNYRKKLA